MDDTKASTPFGLFPLVAVVPPAGRSTGTRADPTAAVFPGNNGGIALTSDRVTLDNPEGDSEIFTMNPDGVGVTQFTFNAVRRPGELVVAGRHADRVRAPPPARLVVMPRNAL
jgi:hypothetical protein